MHDTPINSFAILQRLAPLPSTLPSNTKLISALQLDIVYRLGGWTSDMIDLLAVTRRDEALHNFFLQVSSVPLHSSCLLDCHCFCFPASLAFLAFLTTCASLPLLAFFAFHTHYFSPCFFMFPLLSLAFLTLFLFSFFSAFWPLPPRHQNTSLSSQRHFSAHTVDASPDHFLPTSSAVPMDTTLTAPQSHLHMLSLT